MEGPALLDTAPKTVKAADVPRPESNFGRWMALTAALLGWMFDGFEMGLFPLIGGPGAQRSAGTVVGRAGHAVVRRHHRRVSRRRRDRRRVLRLARRSHRPRARDGAEHLHLCGLHRPLRLRDRSVAHRGAAVRRLARHGRRVVARRRAGQRNLAEQIARADRRAHRRGRESRISHGRPAQHRPAPVHRRRRSAAAAASACRRRWSSACSRTPDGAS